MECEARRLVRRNDAGVVRMANEKTGDWAALDKMFAGVGDRFKKNIEAATKKNGVLIKTAVIQCFEEQGPNWAALSPAYAKRKAAMGNEQILITTGQLMGSISTSYPSYDQGFVGIQRGVMHKDTKGYAEMVNIAAVHEFGSPTRNIPARPFFAPAEKKTSDDVAKNYEAAVEETLKIG